MNDCVFCKIASGEIPSFKVYEDDAYVSFLDNKPLSPGHVQVVPKKHYRYVWDVEDFGGYMTAVHKVAKALQGTFGTEMVYSRVMGDEVHHAHVWLFPAPQSASGELRDFDGNMEKIRARLG